MISTEQIIWVGYFGVTILLAFLFFVLLYSKPRKPKRTGKGIATGGEAKKEGPSLQDSLSILAEALKIVSQESKKYYMKSASEVAEQTLRDVDTAFVPLSNQFLRFGFAWIDSKHSGQDAIEASKALDERIDIKVLQTGNLDFEQLRRIMTRLNRADDALRAIGRISFYITYYKNLCLNKGLNREANHAELLLFGVINQAQYSVESEAMRLRNQIERCNLYFQNALTSKSFKIAYISLLVSSVAVLLSILGTMLPC